MCSQFQSYLLDAINNVLDLDIPESDFAQAVQSQACHQAGIQADEVAGYYAD